jgi:hypothetical protein
VSLRDTGPTCRWGLPGKGTALNFAVAHKLCFYNALPHGPAGSVPWQEGALPCYCETPALAAARGFPGNDLPPFVILSEAKDLGAEDRLLVAGRPPRRGASLHYASFSMTDKGCHCEKGAPSQSGPGGALLRARRGNLRQAGPLLGRGHPTLQPEGDCRVALGRGPGAVRPTCLGLLAMPGKGEEGAPSPHPRSLRRGRATAAPFWRTLFRARRGNLRQVRPLLGLAHHRV